MNINLTTYERLNLYNQYTILQQLSLLQGNEDEAEYYERAAEIISNGYTREYCMISECINEALPEEDAKLVWDTLEMYSAIYSSYHNIANPSLSSDQVRFPGFDGNYEIDCLCYCKFILFELGRYCEFLENDRTDFNSHIERCNKYRAMLAKWNEMNKPANLSEEQIKQLIRT